MKKDEVIEAKTLSGFRDIMPSEALVKERLLSEVKKTLQAFGFVPLETPHIEYAQALLGRAGSEIQKQVYRFEDNGRRDIALRFDHTAPLARCVVQHKNLILPLPFKRYVIGNVFRGERPQAGRYREFTQCDFDFIGTKSIAADAEIVQVIYFILKALKLTHFVIFINNRKILNGLFESLRLSDKANDILREVDKLSKVGLSNVKDVLINKVGLTTEDADHVSEFITIEQKPKESTDLFFERIAYYKDKHLAIGEGIDELENVCDILDKVGVPRENYAISFSTARGLAYYTGLVYETALNDAKDIGSVVSGGRYDDLTKSFSKEELPGVGASIGIDRLMTALDKLGLIKTNCPPASILIANLDKAYLSDSYLLARQLRERGVGVETYPDVVKLKKQFAFAEKRGYTYLIAFGEKEAKTKQYVVADLKTGNKIPAPSLEQLIKVVTVNASEMER